MTYNKSVNGCSGLDNSMLAQKININREIVKISFTLNEGKDYYGAIQLPTKLLMEIIGARMKHRFKIINQIS